MSHHPRALLRENGGLWAQKGWVCQLRMPTCWLTACNSCWQSKSGSLVTVCKAKGWDWRSDGSWFTRPDSQWPLHGCRLTSAWYSHLGLCLQICRQGAKFTFASGWSGHWERWASASKRRVQHVLKWLFLKLFFHFAFASAFPENWIGCKSSGRNQLKHLIECVVSFSSLYFLPTYMWYHCSGIQQAALNGVDGKRAFSSQLYL